MTRPPTAIEPHSATPAQSQMPTIGWPRCEVSASWCTQLGQTKGRCQQVDEVHHDDHDRDHLGRESRHGTHRAKPMPASAAA